jgi:tyrosyl-tRNA synthetase
MWRYYELLTDVQVADIEKMKVDAHPMAAKKDLAHRIVADFHSVDAAMKAAEDWAKQFQKGEVPEHVEEVPISLEDVLPIPVSEIEWSASGQLGGKSYRGIRLDRLLVKCSLAESGSDAARKIKAGAVRVNNSVAEGILILVTGLPAKLSLRVGKRVKIAVIHR